MTQEQFNEIKQEILDRAKAAKACTEQYSLAYKSEDFATLCKVVKDNFNWCCNNNVINAALIEKYKEAFAENEIYVNTSIDKGYLIAYGSATVTAYGSATVTAYGSATVTACDCATVRAYGSATVTAYGSATVTAYGSAKVEAYDSANITSYSMLECKLSNKAIYRVQSTNTIYYSGDIKFVKQN